MVISGMGLLVLFRSVLYKDLIYCEIFIFYIKDFLLKCKLFYIYFFFMENIKNKEIFIMMLKSNY